MSIFIKVLANICNFAYDPINYEHLRKLNVIPDLLLDCITEEEDLFTKRFAMGGISNSSLDPLNRKLFIENEGIPLILSHLSSEDEETVVNTLTCLYFMIQLSTVNLILTPDVVECLEEFKKRSVSPQIANISSIILSDTQNYHLKERSADNNMNNNNNNNNNNTNNDKVDNMAIDLKKLLNKRIEREINNEDPFQSYKKQKCDDNEGNINERDPNSKNEQSQ